MHKVQKIVCNSNEEWRRERCHSIGASAAGILIGENPFTTPMQLAERMRAELNGDFDYTETLAMRRGHAYEGGVAYLFECETGHKIIQSSSAEYILRRDDLPFMHASPDRTYWIDTTKPKYGKFAEQNKGIVECKTTRMTINPDDLPVSWVFQLQIQMGISGYHHGALAWDVLSSSNGFGYQYFDFDEQIFNAAVEVYRDFWYRCIIGGEEPEPVSVADYQRLWPSHTIGKTMTVAKKTVDVLAEIKEMNDTKKELEEAIEKMKNGIKMQFTDEEAMVDMDGKVLATYRTNSKGQRTLLIK